MSEVWTTIGSWLFKGWDSIGRVLLVGVLTYAGLLVLLRISGKRTLSKMSAFDLVVTVALGSTLSSTLVSRSTAVADGLAAMAVLIGLQFAVAWLSVRWQGFQRVVKAEPTLLFHRGRYLRRALRRERVSEDEVLSALRSSGVARAEDALAVVLETDGSFTVVSGKSDAEPTTLQNVQRPQPDRSA